MTAQLNYTIFRHRSAELRRAAERARVATEAPASGRTPLDQDTIARPSQAHGPGPAALEVEPASGGTL